MKTKKVNRYYCDFCKKSGCSARHMKKHEERCTMNPRRKCGVCGILDQVQPPMATLLATLPALDDYPLDPETDSVTPVFISAAEAALPALRDAAGECPACVLAALRQAGVPVPAIDAFDFTMEMKRVWADFNDSQRE